VKITIESDNAKFLAHLQELADKCAIPAQVSALNSAATNVRSKSIQIAKSATGVPTSILKRRIAVPKSRRATIRSHEVLIFGGLWPVKVSKLTPAPRKLKGGGVKYKTLPGQPISPRAFIANNTHGSLSVFERKGEARLPIRNITVDISGPVKSAIAGYLASGAAKAYYEKMLLSQMDRRVRGSLVRKGLTVK
jgi:Prophage minor tail protein Z (GPZ)